MLGADTGKYCGVDGEDVEDVADCAAGCVMAGEEEEFDLAHGEFFEGAV